MVLVDLEPMKSIFKSGFSENTNISSESHYCMIQLGNLLVTKFPNSSYLVHFTITVPIIRKEMIQNENLMLSALDQAGGCMVRNNFTRGSQVFSPVHRNGIITSVSQSS